jgi:Tfp pilus assembly protein FimT
MFDDRDRDDAYPGFTVLELVTSLSIAALATVVATSALSTLISAGRLESARLRLVEMLLEARRAAFVDESTVEVRVEPGSGHVLVVRDATVTAEHMLPHDVRISSAPTTHAVRFYASGLADNATIGLTAPGAGDGVHAAVVINQRGKVR